METAPHITFHQLPHSDALEAEIRTEIEGLERIHERITGCRVVVAAPHRHQQAPLFEVRVDLTIPGDEIVVTRPHEQDAAHENAHLAVRDAFRVVRRQLEAHVQRRATLATRSGQGARKDTETP